jgi:hypothetical protein
MEYFYIFKRGLDDIGFQPEFLRGKLDVFGA